MVRTNKQGQYFLIPGCSKPTALAQLSKIKYNKTVLYAPSFIQQGTMLIADILNADLKIPTLTQCNKWKKDLHTGDVDTKWETICFQICYIIPVKLRSFYLKFMHRALPCKLYIIQYENNTNRLLQILL